MIYRFLMLSDEAESFRREYRLDAEANFLEFHDLILESVGYKRDESISFFICEDDWSKGSEISLIEKSTRSEVDTIIMEDTPLDEYLEEERQKLMFVFDHTHERAFYMELREIIFGEGIDKPEISKSIGTAPEQFLPIEEEIPVTVAPIVPPVDDIDDLYEEEDSDYTDDNYGNSHYNEDELDSDGFDEVDEEGIEDINIEDLDI